MNATVRTGALLVLLLPAALLLAAACVDGNLAEADGRRLTVDHAAQLILDHSTVPGDSQVVRVVAELWVDYTLLAERLEADTALSSLDVDDVVRQPLEEEMLARLSEEVVEADTVVDDQELAERFAAEMPGAQATASQILLLFPPGATNRQRDSVRSAAEGLREQIAAGADFAVLAERFSADRGSAARGGSMGTFERGEMLAAVDSAVFRLRPGEMSEPVATELGYHVLRLERIQVPELSEAGAEFRRRIQVERLAEAEAAYIAMLDSASGLALADDALSVARALAEATPGALSRRAARRPLLTWSDGAYTASALLDVIRLSPAGFAESVAGADDEELEAALRQVARRELLLTEARARGLEAGQARVDSLREAARAAVLARAREIGLAAPPPGDGTDMDADAASPPDSAAALTVPLADSAPPARDDPQQAPAPVAPASQPASAEERVEATLIRILSGRQEIIPLGAVIMLLRDQADWRIHETRIGAVLARLEELRSAIAGVRD